MQTPWEKERELAGLQEHFEVEVAHWEKELI